MEGTSNSTAYGGSQEAATASPAGVVSTYIKPQGRKPHDPDVKFEEYYYYAQKTREEEKAYVAPKTNW